MNENQDTAMFIRVGCSCLYDYAELADQNYCLMDHLEDSLISTHKKILFVSKRIISTTL